MGSRSPGACLMRGEVAQMRTAHLLRMATTPPGSRRPCHTSEPGQRSTQCQCEGERWGERLWTTSCLKTETMLTVYCVVDYRGKSLYDLEGERMEKPRPEFYKPAGIPICVPCILPVISVHGEQIAAPSSFLLC